VNPETANTRKIVYGTHCGHAFLLAKQELGTKARVKPGGNTRSGGRLVAITLLDKSKNAPVPR
jgi:hypothetical protein